MSIQKQKDVFRLKLDNAQLQATDSNESTLKKLHLNNKKIQ